MSSYAASIIAVRRKNDAENSLEITHNAFMVEAPNELVAKNKALEVAYRVYPKYEGWDSHHSVIDTGFEVIDDPTHAKIVTQDMQLGKFVEEVVSHAK